MAGQSMRDIKRRIQSVKNTQQITKAMEMVSAAKLRRAQTRAITARPFANKLREVLARLVVATGRTGAYDHPLLQVREVRRVAYVVIAADRGLAGGYNANVIRYGLGKLRAQTRETVVIPVGRKARDAFRRLGFTIPRDYTGLGDEISLSDAHDLARYLMELYETGEVDEVHLVYSQFISAISQRPVSEQLLPVSRGEMEQGDRTTDGQQADGAAAGADYIYEPSPEAVLGLLLPRYVENLVYRALLEAKASEHGARMSAMRNATENAEEMIEYLTLSFNRARQASITKELAEIVGGAEALAAGG